MGKKVKINLHDYDYKCADGCCDWWGTIVKVNGEQLESENQDTGSIVRAILEHLGYTVEIVETGDYD